MSNILGGLYSFGNSLKRNVKDFARSPDAYLTQAADELRRRMRTEPEKVVMDAANLGPLGSLAGVIKQKGGNWLSGSVEDALRGLRRDLGVLSEEGFRNATPQTPGYEIAAPRAALNRWIDQKLAKYVKNEMATPEDPIRALAEQGKLHVSPEQLTHGNRQVHLSGEHLKKLAESPSALRWENAADYVIYPEQARTFKRSVSGATGRPTVERNPWLEKLPDETPVYDLIPGPIDSNLGFPHLIDELTNAINPTSDLPQHLRFPVDRLDKVTVPQAVERVSQINAYRAAKQAEADALRANNAATVLHKEYPDDPRGMRWVELRQPEDLPEGFSIRPTESGVFEVVEPSGAVNVARTEEEARRIAFGAAQTKGQSALRDALKYEGDTMQHCVGGYCDDVASGRTRIYSLRDKKGQPHVTIEMRPPQGFAGKKSREEYEAWLRAHATPHGEKEIQGALMELDKGGAWDPSILQIKGKQNRKPNDEYLPFVQDFVRSGKWSDVRDLENAGLVRRSDEDTMLRKFGKWDLPEEAYDDFDALPEYVTDADIAEWLKKKGYASGGKVDGRTGGTRIRNTEEDLPLAWPF
jgi:hypothetical protein